MSTPQDWLRARWSQLSAVVDRAPPAWAAWARRELTEDDVGAGLARTADPAAPMAGGYDRAQLAERRVALGQVFTPEPLADLLVQLAGVGRSEDRWPSPIVLDPACGAGSLLVAAARARRDAGMTVADALATLEGWDRDPGAVWSCRAALVEWALSEVVDVEPLPGVLWVRRADALSTGGAPGDLLRRQGAYAMGVGAVIGNPPYLEAKRMGTAEPGLKERLKAAFPELRGAFDLYLAFCLRALDQLGPGGQLALILPGKVLQGRYAAVFRERLLGIGDPAAPLVDLVDLTRCKPRPFPGTGVYPVLLHAERGAEPPRHDVRTHRVERAGDLTVPVARWGRVAHAELARVGGDHPLFVPFRETWPALAPLLDLPRLGSVARIASTTSFHHKGLRERFVTEHRPDGPAWPYLGGPSHARRAEVASFRTAWAGWWIRYDALALSTRWKNPVPDLDTTFARPKAIFCQHATRLRVVADPTGRWVTKDVYPVAWPTGELPLAALVAVLSSTVFTALYNTFYQGVLVGGETYHYLPAFLATVPVPPSVPDVQPLVDALHAHDGPVDLGLWDALDRIVAEAYGVDERDRRRMIEVHLRRVGAEAPSAG